MFNTPIFRIIKQMTNDDLIKEKQTLVKWLYSCEKRLSGKKAMLCEDDKALYTIYIDRLYEIIGEIADRIENDKWIFAKEI